MELFGYSEQKSEKIKLESGNKYRTRKWHTAATTVECFKLIKVFTPMLTMYADVKTATKGVNELESLLDSGQPDYVYTKGFTQVAEHLTPEHFIDLQNKLLEGVQYFDTENEEWVSIGDWSEFFSDNKFSGDWLEVVVWSFRVNLMDFLLRQSMFRSLVDKMTVLLAKLMDNKETPEGV